MSRAKSYSEMKVLKRYLVVALYIRIITLFCQIVVSNNETV